MKQFFFLSLSNQRAESVPGTANIGVDRERTERFPLPAPSVGKGQEGRAAGLAEEGGGGCRTTVTPSPSKVPSTSPKCPHNLNFCLQNQLVNRC